MNVPTALEVQMNAMIRRALPALVALSAGAGHVRAQAPTAASAMTLEQAVRYALAHHPAVAGALARIDGARASRDLAAAARIPTLDAAAMVGGATGNVTAGSFFPMSGGLNQAISNQYGPLADHALTLYGLNGAAARLIGAVNEARYARLDHCAGAHAARLDGHVQRGVREAVISQHARGLPQHHNFGVRGGIAIANGAIPGARHNLSLVNQHRSDGHFSAGGRGARLVQSLLHKLKIDLAVHVSSRLTR